MLTTNSFVMLSGCASATSGSTTFISRSFCLKVLAIRKKIRSRNTTSISGIMFGMPSSGSVCGSFIGRSSAMIHRFAHSPAGLGQRALRGGLLHADEAGNRFRQIRVDLPQQLLALAVEQGAEQDRRD